MNDRRTYQITSRPVDNPRPPIIKLVSRPIRPPITKPVPTITRPVPPITKPVPTITRPVPTIIKPVPTITKPVSKPVPTITKPIVRTIAAINKPTTKESNPNIIPYPHQEPVSIANGSRNNISIGANVSYEGKKGEYIHGIVTKLNKKTVGVNTNGTVKLIPYEKIRINLIPLFDDEDDKPLIDPNFPDEIRPTFTYPVIGKYSSKFIEFYRVKIQQSLTKKYYRVNQRDVHLPDEMLVDMWNMYDRFFFRGHLAKILVSTETQLQIGFTSQPTATASYCTSQGCIYKILINSNIINSLFRNINNANQTNVGSLLCNNKIGCCMLEVEQALLRYIIYANPYYDPNNPLYDMNGIWFSQLLFAYFNSVYTPENVLGSKYQYQDFVIGQIVKYQYSLVDTAYGKISDLTSTGAIINGNNFRYNVIYPVTEAEKVDYELHVGEDGIYIKSEESNISEKPFVDTKEKSLSYDIPQIAYPVRTKYTDEFITYHRKIIHDDILAKYGQDAAVSLELVTDMFSLYDRYFFQNFITETLKDLGLDFIIQLRDGPTKSYGSIKCTYDSITLTIEESFYNKLDAKIKPLYTILPLNCNTIFNCLQETIEHESIHILQYMSRVGVQNEGPIFDAHGEYFQRLVYAFFRHTETVSNATHDNDIKINFKIGDYALLGLKNIVSFHSIVKIVDIIGDDYHLSNGFVEKSDLLYAVTPKIVANAKEHLYYLHDSRINNINISFEPLPQFTYPMTMGYSQKFIDFNLNSIYTYILQKYQITNNKNQVLDISNGLIEDLYRMIDLYFFKGFVFNNIEHMPIIFNIVRSAESNVIASCNKNHCQYNVTISTRVLETLAREINQHPDQLHYFGNIACTNLVHCTMLLLIDSILDLLIAMIQTLNIMPDISENIDDFKTQLRYAFFRL